MPIRSDKWIRKMSEEHGMIEPFVPDQVREDCISYGLSSYGYDIRVAPEFKVFTNVHNVVVDPKHFDPRSFVDVRASECIIPPNSFALARTEEYFRIPRDTLVICVGKSTYARCFRGDTRVALVDGTAPTLEEMARRAEDGEMFRGYSVGRHGRVIVTLLDAPRCVGQDALLELKLDDGAPIRCTPDHEFLLRDGRVVPADDLRPGDSLMPLRDHDRRNNNPWNLERMEASEHIRHHNEETHGEEFDPAEHGSAIAGVISESRGKRSVRNHKVESVRSLAGDHDVYCLTVPEAGNFALDSGVFVRNCGIIVNVTPLEPTWCGYLTLEISNTTPLPAKIYGGEGIAQLLFFEGDEEPTTAYADRQGKYQDQTGVTLPRL